MSGLDTLITTSLDLNIRRDLDKETIKKIEQKLSERYGLNLTQAIGDFAKLDSVLQEFFGKETKDIEKQIIDKIIKLDNSTHEDTKWLTIEDPLLTQLILESLGDEDMQNILNAVIDEPKVISRILQISNVPTTSGYRKINTMIQNGLLIPTGFVMIDEKKIRTYKSIFENIRINIKRNRIVAKVLLSKEFFEISTIMQSIYRQPMLLYAENS